MIASLAHGARALCPQTNLFLIGLVLFLTGHLALGLWHCVRPEGAVCRSKHGLQAIGDPAALARRLLDFDERSFGAVSSRLATAAIARKGAAGSHPLSADILLGCWSSRELRCVIAVLEGSPDARARQQIAHELAAKAASLGGSEGPADSLPPPYLEVQDAVWVGRHYVPRSHIGLRRCRPPARQLGTRIPADWLEVCCVFNRTGRGCVMCDVWCGGPQEGE